MERNKIKIGWTSALIAVGWVLMFLPSAEDLPDAQPATSLEWKLFIALNFVLIVYVHILNVREHQRQLRIEANQRYWERMETRARNNHPTAK